LINNKEKYVFGDGKYCIFERENAERQNLFYGVLSFLFEREEERRRLRRKQEGGVYLFYVGVSGPDPAKLWIFR